MTTHREVPETVRIAGRDVPLLVAALMAQEADRLGVLVGKVGRVAIPEPAPTSVVIAGCSVSIEAGARIAEAADARRLHPKRLIELIVGEYVEALARK